MSGVIANAGLVRTIAPEVRCGLVVNLSAGTLLGAHPTSKVLGASVARAVSLGADAVSVQIHFGDGQEDRMIADAGRIADDAHASGLPLLVMAYPPSEAVRVSADVAATRHAARAGAEIGGDLVQTNYVGPEDALREIVRGCPAPLLLAGGPKASSSDAYFDAVRAGLAAGAAGVTVGRNLFQDPDPAAFAARIAGLVFGPGAKVAVEVSR